MDRSGELATRGSHGREVGPMNAILKNLDDATVAATAGAPSSICRDADRRERQLFQSLDYDNDGFRDLFVSNGYPRDVTDLDYAVSGMSRGRGMSNEEQMMMIPVRSMSNYIFKNNGDLTFTKVTAEWGFNGNYCFSRRDR